jgi:Cu+-exporting ATPase
MSAADILVVVVAVAALAGLGWFFFGPRMAAALATPDGGMS